MHMIRRALTLAAVTTALVASASGAALADPSPGTVPALTENVGVSCSPLFDQLATDSGAFNCWDEVNPSTGNPGDTITTKGSSSSDTTCSMARPNGSGAGIAALEANRRDGGYYCADFVDSSRAPASTDPTTIAFASYAKDAIAWATPAGTSSHPSPAPSTLTWQDLINIYTCVDTNWDQVGGSNAPIVPVIPQNGAGTRATFLLALGGGTTPLNPANEPCIVNGTTAAGANIEENTGLSAGNVAQFDPSGVPAVDDIVPYSIGDFIAQGASANGVGGHASAIWGHGVLQVHAATDSSGTVQQPTATNSSSQTIINRSYPAQLQSLLYAVVRNSGTPTAPAFPAPGANQTSLSSVFGRNSGWLCSNATAKADIVSYGFATLTVVQCGGLNVG